MLSNFDIGMFDIIGLACVLVPALIAFIYIKMIKPWLGKKKTKKLKESGILKTLEVIWMESYEYIHKEESTFILSSDLYDELYDIYTAQMFSNEIMPMTFNGIAVIEDIHLEEDTIILMRTTDYNCNHS